MECFVEGVEEVADDYENVYASAMTFESWCLGEWSWVSGSNGNAIVDTLQKRCRVLIVCQ